MTALLDTTVLQVFDFGPEAVRKARRLAGGALAGLDETLFDDVLLCVSEVATNAVKHAGSGAGDGQFLLKVARSDLRVRVECHDAHPAWPYLCNPSTADTGGRGLLLVDGLTTRWGVTHLRHGKFVWFEIDTKAEDMGGVEAC